MEHAEDVITQHTMEWALALHATLNRDLEKLHQAGHIKHTGAMANLRDKAEEIILGLADLRTAVAVDLRNLRLEPMNAEHHSRNGR